MCHYAGSGRKIPVRLHHGEASSLAQRSPRPGLAVHEVPDHPQVRQQVGRHLFGRHARWSLCEDEVAFSIGRTTSAEPPATYTNERSEPASIPGRLQCHVRRQILMPLWQVRLNGKNFWLRMNGSPGRFGFYTTRYVEATDAREAELVAVQLIRDDPELRGVINERADPPMIHAEEIIPVPVPDAKVPNAGYT